MSEPTPALHPWPSRWRKPLAVEGECTTDNRLIEPGALHWDEGPFPLHCEGKAVGHVEAVERRGSVIWGSGTLKFSLGDEALDRSLASAIANGQLAVCIEDYEFELEWPDDDQGGDDLATLIERTGRARLASVKVELDPSLAPIWPSLRSPLPE